MSDPCRRNSDARRVGDSPGGVRLSFGAARFSRRRPFPRGCAAPPACPRAGMWKVAEPNWGCPSIMKSWVLVLVPVPGGVRRRRVAGGHASGRPVLQFEDSPALVFRVIGPGRTLDSHLLGDALQVLLQVVQTPDDMHMVWLRAAHSICSSRSMSGRPRRRPRNRSSRWHHRWRCAFRCIPPPSPPGEIAPGTSCRPA